LRNRLFRTLAAVLGLGLLAALGGGAWLALRVRASLPRLDGDLRLAGLAAPVTVERDALGVPTIRGGGRGDIARATGFLHAQERYFQMDLLRRSAAGELAELVGPAAVETDRAVRLHRFRSAAAAIAGGASDDDRRLLAAYAEGASAGLAALGAPPPEYLALGATPEPWRPEDTILTVFAMYLTLQDSTGEVDSERGLLRDLLPRELAEFLDPGGTEWDAPLRGAALAAPPVPPASVLDLRTGPPGPRPGVETPVAHPPAAGSNAWAVAGTHAAGGRALLANDMHLGLSLPNTWYRASFAWPDDEGQGEIRVTGVTLPGAPAMVVGSNGHVAWGFTNSYADLSDLVVLEDDPAGPARYLTPEGPRAIEHHAEVIRIKGAADERLDVAWTRWGPLVDRDHHGRRRALRWVAHDPAAVDLGLVRMERARSVDEALDLAAEVRIPTQNCVVADAAGRIGWTLIGPLPRRVGTDGRRPASWASGSVGWNGWLSAADRPALADPPSGRIWSANQRAVDGPALAQLGDGGYALGARAGRIRDALQSLDAPAAPDMLALQLDDHNVLFARWRELLLSVLTDEAVRDDPRRDALRRIVVRDGTGRAAIDSAGYRLVRGFRGVLGRQVLEALTAPCRAVDPGFNLARRPQSEGPLWALVTARPAHLLDPRFAGWDAQLLAAADRLLDQLLPAGQDPDTLAARTWGELNTVRVAHPLGRAVPWLSRWLDVPPEPLPGDADAPRVQGRSFGASMRMVVSPGDEAHGLFHMPGGQSGHPWSPYYTAGHRDWARGTATPFLPGPARYRLTLRP